MRRFLLLLAVSTSSIMLDHTPAGAACALPGLDPSLVRNEVLRGGEIIVHGGGFGHMDADNGQECPLGTPMDDISIVFTQGSDEVVVARGSADEHYEFLLKVVVPTSLRPGPALLGVRLPEFDEPIGAFQVVVADSRPPADVDESVRTFGERSDQPSSDGFGAWPLVLLAIAIVGLAVARRFD